MKKKIVYANNEGVFLHIPLLKDLLIKKQNSVFDLCTHKDTIIEANYDGRIWDVIKNKVVAKRSQIYDALSVGSHDGVLYDGSYYGKIRETLSGRLVDKRLDEHGCYQPVHSFASHDGKLYASASHGVYEIREGLDSRLITKRNWVLSVCSHGGKLYDAGRHGVADTLTGEEVFNFGRTLPMHWDHKQVNDLISHKGKLMHVFEGKLYDTFKNKRIRGPDRIRAVCSIDEHIVKRLKEEVFK